MSQLIPAYWITEEQARDLYEWIAAHDASSVGTLLDTAEPVPRDDDQIGPALFGVLFNFLALNGIDFPSQRVPGFGILVVVDRDNSGRLQRDLESFVEHADDELLSDEEVNALVLYEGEPQLVRRAIHYFIRGLSIPPERFAVMVLGR